MSRQPTLKTKCAKCAMFFESSGFCANLTETELVDLSNQSRTMDLKRGETFSEDQLRSWPIIAITSGVFSIQHLLEDGRKSIAALFMRGDIIDMRSFSRRNRGQLIALSKTEVCRLSPAVFENIVATNPNARHIVWDNLRDQSFRAQDHAADLSKKQALEKLASFIFECKSRQQVNLTPGAVSIPIRRVDLAEYLGMQPETISRCFKDLEDRGIVEMKSLRAVNIKNIPVLRRIANGDKSASVAKTHSIRILSVA
ncbi:MAG: Crp/Fnr family transcriptional regulator [Rhodobacteraceae bacterium]|nr:Crp/Fnr family transcriptional regulator [Paracoccaceae bacterium]